MGTSASAKELAGKIRQAGDNLRNSQVESCRDGALVMKQHLLIGAVRAAGGDRRLSNLGRATLNVGFDIKGTINPAALFHARGPWALTEYGAGAHFITSRHGGGSRNSRARRLGGLSSGKGRGSEVAFGPGLGRGGRVGGAVKIPGAPRGYRLYARHPGTKGKGTWQRAREQGARPTLRAMRQAPLAAVRRPF